MSLYLFRLTFRRNKKVLKTSMLHRRQVVLQYIPRLRACLWKGLEIPDGASLFLWNCSTGGPLWICSRGTQWFAYAAMKNCYRSMEIGSTRVLWWSLRSVCSRAREPLYEFRSHCIDTKQLYEILSSTNKIFVRVTRKLFEWKQQHEFLVTKTKGNDDAPLAKKWK